MGTSTFETGFTPPSIEDDQTIEDVKSEIESEIGYEMQSIEMLSESSFKQIYLVEDKEGQKYSVFLYSGKQNSEIQLASNNIKKAETIIKSGKNINIAKVYDSGYISLSDQGERGFYIVKEYLEGRVLPDDISDLDAFSEKMSRYSQNEKLAQKTLDELKEMVGGGGLQTAKENARKTAPQIFPSKSFEQLEEKTKNKLLKGEIRALLNDETPVNIEGRQRRVDELKSDMWPKLREAGEQLSQLHDLDLAFGDFKLDNIFVVDEETYFIDLDTVSDLKNTKDSDLSRKVATPQVNLEPGLYTQDTKKAIKILRQLVEEDLIKFSEKLQEGVSEAVKYIRNSQALRSNFLSEEFQQDIEEKLSDISKKEQPMHTTGKLARLCYDYLLNLKRGSDYGSEESRGFFNNSKRDVRSYGVSVFDLVTKAVGTESFGPAPAISLTDLGLSQREEGDDWHFGPTEKKAQNLAFGLLREHGEAPKQVLKALFVSADLEQIEDVRPSISELHDGFENWLEILSQEEKVVENMVVIMNLIGNKEKLSEVVQQIMKGDLDREYLHELKSIFETLGLEVESKSELEQEIEKLITKGKDIITTNNNQEDEK